MQIKHLHALSIVPIDCTPNKSVAESRHYIALTCGMWVMMRRSFSAMCRTVSDNFNLQLVVSGGADVRCCGSAAAVAVRWADYRLFSLLAAAFCVHDSSSRTSMQLLLGRPNGNSLYFAADVCSSVAVCIYVSPKYSRSSPQAVHLAVEKWANRGLYFEIFDEYLLKILQGIKSNLQNFEVFFTPIAFGSLSCSDRKLNAHSSSFEMQQLSEI